ncbi:MAG: MBOAT family protein [Lachnospiraceae bacterium]|nr:MBOAT family protein [Lachnospiraceae bacterium]
MIFSSLLFLFWFLPIFFTLYYVCPAKYRNIVLFAGSIVFYGWGEPKFLILLLLSIIVNYAAGRLIGHFTGPARKISLIFALVFDFGMLLFFKYINFFIGNLNHLTGLHLTDVAVTLPLGISFYTFQIASYVIDVYRGKVRAERSILTLGTYLCMFPQLIAGPIVVYADVAEKLHERRVTLSEITDGVSIFILGLGSKVLIANNVGALWTEAGKIGYENLSTPLAWLAMLSFSLQIYFDFNGYSLMAIGLGKMLGFTFPKNFNHPYMARSITDFWRRWHMTLSGWFREYVYIPLGGNRKGTARTYVNLLIVWALTGFWHGADWNFILWGLFFFVVLAVEKLFLTDFLEKHPVFSHVYAKLLIAFSWMLFAITDFSQIGVFFTRLFGLKGGTDWLYYGRNYGVILLIGCILSTPVLSGLFERYGKRIPGIAVCMLIFLASVAYLADAGYNPFLYFRF